METWRVVVGLAVVFGLLALLRRLAARTSGRGAWRLLGSRPTLGSVLRIVRRTDATEPLRLVRRLNLTATHQLHVVADESATLLICTHPQGCTVLRKRALEATLSHSERATRLRKHAS